MVLAHPASTSMASLSVGKEDLGHSWRWLVSIGGREMTLVGCFICLTCGEPMTRCDDCEEYKCHCTTKEMHYFDLDYKICHECYEGG